MDFDLFLFDLILICCFFGLDLSSDYFWYWFRSMSAYNSWSPWLPLLCKEKRSCDSYMLGFLILVCNFCLFCALFRLILSVRVGLFHKTLRKNGFSIGICVDLLLCFIWFCGRLLYNLNLLRCNIVSPSFIIMVAVRAHVGDSLVSLCIRKIWILIRIKNPNNIFLLSLFGWSFGLWQMIDPANGPRRLTDD